MSAQSAAVFPWAALAPASGAQSGANTPGAAPLRAAREPLAQPRSSRRRTAAVAPPRSRRSAGRLGQPDHGRLAADRRHHGGLQERGRLGGCPPLRQQPGRLLAEEPGDDRVGLARGQQVGALIVDRLLEADRLELAAADW